MRPAAGSWSSALPEPVFTDHEFGGRAVDANVAAARARTKAAVHAASLDVAGPGLHAHIALAFFFDA